MRSFSCRPRRSLDCTPTAKLIASMKFDLPGAQRWARMVRREPWYPRARPPPNAQPYSPATSVHTCTVRSDDRGEVQEGPERGLAAVALEVDEVETGDAAAARPRVGLGRLGRHGRCGLRACRARSGRVARAALEWGVKRDHAGVSDRCRKLFPAEPPDRARPPRATARPRVAAAAQAGCYYGRCMWM